MLTDDLSTAESSTAGGPRPVHFMYIQMELCDKQTLRNCIDDNLYRDTAKVEHLHYDSLFCFC